MPSPPEAKPTHDPKKVGTMDPVHIMDYAPLNLGYPSVSSRIVHLADLDVHVLGLDEIANSDLPIAVVILAHGFANRATQMYPMAAGLIGEVSRLGQKRRDLLVVTLDQRNHGPRRRVRPKLALHDSPWRMINMATTIIGGVQDHQLILDVLPAYLFPHGERVVEEFMSAGISMGGQVCWRLMRDEPRIRVGVPIASIRCEAQWESLLRDPKAPETYFPPEMRSFFYDENTSGYKGKRILSLTGGLDALFSPQESEKAWERVRREGEEGEMEMVVQEGRGHVVTPEMVVMAAEWLWRWGLRVGSGVDDCRVEG